MAQAIEYHIRQRSADDMPAKGDTAPSDEKGPKEHMRACGICGTRNIPFGVVWPAWADGKPICDNCAALEKPWAQAAPRFTVRSGGNCFYILDRGRMIGSRMTVQDARDTVAELNAGEGR